MKQTLRKQLEGAKVGGMQTLGAASRILYDNAPAMQKFMQLMSLRNTSKLAEEIKNLEVLFKQEKDWAPKVEEHDGGRLTLILRLCDFAIKYLSSKPRNKHKNLIVNEMLEGIDLTDKRRTLEHISDLICNLSYNFKDRFRGCIPEKPFYWETFEKLGALMKPWGAGSDQTPGNKSHILGLQNLSKELGARELIIESAMNDLMTEVPEIMRLIQFILDNHSRSVNDLAYFNKIKVPIIMGFVTRLEDTKNIRELLKLSNNTLYLNNHSEWFSQRAGTFGELQISPPTTPFQGFANTNLLEKHAFLRRLQSLGELLTAKSLSTYSLRLIDGINLRAISDIRNVLTHQEKAIHKQNVLELLMDFELLDKSFEDMEALNEKVLQLNDRRVKRLPFPVVQDTEEATALEEKMIDEFWAEIKKGIHNGASTNSLQNSKKTFTAKFINEDAALKFFARLKSKKVPDNYVSQWASVFTAQSADRPDYTKLILELRNYFSENEEFNEMQNLSKKAKKAKGDKKSKEQRATEHEKLREEKEERHANSTGDLPGIEGIHKLLLPPNYNLSKDKELSYEEHVRYAVEALKNIKEFLQQDKTAILVFNTLLAQKTGTENEVLGFLASLSSNPKLYAAIEYNASLLFCHLPKVVDAQKSILLKDIPGFEHFIKNDSQREMRALRNHLEHGRPMLDSEERAPFELNLYPNLSPKQKAVSINIILLVGELYPLLLKLRIKLLKEQLSSINSKLAISRSNISCKAATLENISNEFFEAAKTNEADKLMELYVKYPNHDLDSIDERGFTALHRACIYAATNSHQSKSIEAAKSLILHGASIEPKTEAKKLPLEFLSDETVITLIIDIIDEQKPLLNVQPPLIFSQGGLRNDEAFVRMSYYILSANKSRDKSINFIGELAIQNGFDGDGRLGRSLNKLKETAIYSKFGFSQLLMGQRTAQENNDEILIDGGVLTKVETPGDGHCLYNAVSLYLGTDAQTLRNNVADYIEENRNEEEFNNKLEAAIAAANSDPNAQQVTMDAYIASIRDREWADGLEIAVLEMVHRRPIVIIGPNEETRSINNNMRSEPIYVLYNGRDHYDGLVKVVKDKPVIFSNLSPSFRNQQSALALNHEGPEIDRANSISELQEYKKKNQSKPAYCKAMEIIVMKSLGYELDGQVETGAVNMNLSWHEAGAARELDKKSVINELSTTLLAAMANAESVPAQRLEEFCSQYLQIIGKAPTVTPVFRVQGYRLGNIGGF